MFLRKAFGFGAVAFLCLAGAAHAQLGIYGTYSGQRFSGIACPPVAVSCASSNGAVKPFGASLGAYYDFKTYGPVRFGIDARGELLHSNKRADSFEGSNGAVREYNTLVGVRGTIRTSLSWLHPYAELAGGYTRNSNSALYTTTTTTTTFSPQTTPPSGPIVTTVTSYNPSFFSNYALFKGFVGVDLALFPHVEIRPIELGYGEAFGAPLNAQAVSVANTVDGNQSDPNYGKVTSSTSKVTGNGFGSNSHQTMSISAGIVFRLP